MHEIILRIEMMYITYNKTTESVISRNRSNLSHIKKEHYVNENKRVFPTYIL